KAKAQVASFNYPTPAKEFFVSAASGYCKKGQNGDFLAKATLPVDGTQTWPAATDTDSDGYWDALDNCPTKANPNQIDTDNDGEGDACEDADNDTVIDSLDNCPTLANTDQLNTDGDTQGNVCDNDDDNDNVVDAQDAFPLDASESVDTDNDGTGNNADLDDDNDQIPDVWELANGLNPLDASDASGDSDRDGISNLDEYLAGSNPNDPLFTWDIDGDGVAKPLTDGLLNLRYHFGFRGDTLINGAVDANATRTTAVEIESYLADSMAEGDIDGDGTTKPLTDGLILLRYLFGFRGDTLIQNAVDATATRSTATEVENYSTTRMPQ
ncbi:MAG: thrombospondin type 3 repeat-containing protein, partial [Thiotrichaceae bacterium]